MAESFEQLSEQVLLLRTQLAKAKLEAEDEGVIGMLMAKLAGTIEQQKLVVEAAAVEVKMRELMLSGVSVKKEEGDERSPEWTKEKRGEERKGKERKIPDEVPKLMVPQGITFLPILEVVEFIVGYETEMKVAGWMVRLQKTI